MNPRYSDIQRQTTAGHVTNTIQARHYSSRNPGIDSQAAFMRTQARLTSVGEHFRNLEITWEPQLWQKLPIAKLEELRGTEEYRKVEAQLCEDSGIQVKQPVKLEQPVEMEQPRELTPTDQLIKAELGTPSPTESEDTTLAHPVRKLRRQLQALERAELKKVWRESSNAEMVTDKSSFVVRGVSRPFTRLRSIMPLRRQLADLLTIPARLRSPEGRESLETLIKLYNSKTEVDRVGLGMCHCARASS